MPGRLLRLDPALTTLFLIGLITSPRTSEADSRGAPFGFYSFTRTGKTSYIIEGEKKLPKCGSQIESLADPFSTIEVDMQSGVKVNGSKWRVKAFHDGLITVQYRHPNTPIILLTFGFVKKRPYALLLVQSKEQDKRCASTWIYSGDYEKAKSDKVSN